MGKKYSSAAREYTAPALEKGLDILELLAQQEDGVTQQQISTALGRSTSEIYRMLSILQQRGYIHRGAVDELYRLAPKLFVIAQQHPPLLRLQEFAMPVMRRLTKQIGQACHLGIADEGYMLVTSQVDAPGFFNFSVRIGTRVKLPLTGSGMVMLAFQSDETRDHWLAEASDIKQNAAANVHESLIRRLKTIRRRGFEQRTSHFVGGVTDLSAPVKDHTGNAVAGMTVPFLLQKQNDSSLEESRDQLVQAARELSIQLGSETAIQPIKE